LQPNPTRIEDQWVGILGALFALLALGAGYQRLGLRRDRRRFPPPGRLIDVAGHRLHAVCRGDGSPVVLLESAIAASSLGWVVVQGEIAKFTRVCAYDRAGLAWSDGPSSPRTFERIVDELSRVLAQVDLPRHSVLVGHSFGSFIVRSYAARHPTQVTGIVLVDPPTEWLTRTSQRARLLRGGRQLSRIGALLAHLGIVRTCLALLTGGAPAAPRRFVKVFGPTTARTLERIVGEVRKLPPDLHPVVQALWCQPKCFHAMADYIGALEREGPSLLAEAPPPDIPLVVISSGDQPPEQLDAHRRLAAKATHGRHVVAARSGHWVQLDEPELVVSVVRELVERVRSGGASGLTGGRHPTE
jgi:pimeloyl-ACP methyl ester carboxylesterase